MNKVCGIYCISNCITGKKYIGKSIDVNTRYRQHLLKLRLGSHHSNHLQRAFDKYGEGSFVFGVIEECSTDDLDSKEKYWIDYYDTYNNGYNCALPNGKNNGHIFTDEDKQKHSIAMKLARSRDSVESRRKIIAGLAKGRLNAIGKRVRSLILYDSKTLELVYKSRSIMDSASFIGVPYKTMNKALIRLNNRRQWTYRGYIIIRDNGIESLEKYIEERNIHNDIVKQNKINAKIRGEQRIIKAKEQQILNKINNTDNRLRSWKLNSDKAIEKLRESGKSSIDVFVKDTGEYFGRWSLQSDFANEFNLSKNKMSMVLSGKKKSYAGYVFKYVIPK